MEASNIPVVSRWLTPQEAAKYIKCGLSTLAIYRSMGTGPRYVKWNASSVRYDIQDLDEWLEQRKVTPEPKPAAAEKRPVGRPRKHAVVALEVRV